MLSMGLTFSRNRINCLTFGSKHRDTKKILTGLIMSSIFRTSNRMTIFWANSGLLMIWADLDRMKPLPGMTT